ncbi:diacylglycerol/lipid kinase family protein [Nisaea nitritireducens]|uniref:diacylglycerol/lipid kinase family protein n=1 Tax=Nisaea nitritireducens TaxID=568392 RepID=UPI001866F889|nr:diacylglycerol kinase family protein [Nisaea nitritireducens]
MRAVAVLNRDGGTLKTTDLNAYAETLTAAFEEAGRSLECRQVAGRDLIEALEDAAGDRAVELIVAGGGDGTISAAARIAWQADKALGVLPAGTMNLFARALGIPLDLETAAIALAKAPISTSDLATANGEVFVHQFSVGMQPRVVRDREAADYYSRMGKMLASLRAIAAMFQRPPSFPARIVIDDTEEEGRYSLVVVANNLYGESHMPYPDTLEGGVLGIGRAPVLPPSANLRMIADLAAGEWRRNDDFDMHPARSVSLHFPRLTHDAHATVDGELVPLKETVELKIHPGALKVLKP